MMKLRIPSLSSVQPFRENEKIGHKPYRQIESLGVDGEGRPEPSDEVTIRIYGMNKDAVDSVADLVFFASDAVAVLSKCIHVLRKVAINNNPDLDDLASVACDAAQDIVAKFEVE